MSSFLSQVFVSIRYDVVDTGIAAPNSFVGIGTLSDMSVCSWERGRCV
jgi:hypothetical protein